MKEKILVCGTGARWKSGELLDEIRKKKAELELHIEPMYIRPISELLNSQLDNIDKQMDMMIRRMQENNEMYIICELAKRYIEDEKHQRRIVLCRDCTIKKAVPHKDGIVWRCPNRTHDVSMDGYCEYGRRAE
jgi:hypothetical protein